MAESADPALYIHIPFCVRRCHYCDFYSVTDLHRDLFQNVLNQLLIDLKEEIQLFNFSGFSSIFIGGGTPSLLPIDLFEPFLKELNSLCAQVGEFTIEANPESIHRDFLTLISDMGLDRLSIGIQTYNDDLLKWLGRPAGSKAILQAEELIDRFWKGQLSCDILAALPLSPGRLNSDILRAKGKSHLSVYELTVEENTALAKDSNRLSKLPDEDSKYQEWKSSLSLLNDLGFTRYEVSNFAKSDQICRHNMSYWRLNPYLGIGPGAASTLSVKGKAERRRECPDILRWMNDRLGSMERETLSSRDFVFEHFLMGLRITEGLQRRNFEGIFGIDPADLIPETLEHWSKAGFLAVEDNCIRVLPDGLDLLDGICRDILGEMRTKSMGSEYTWPHSG